MDKYFIPRNVMELDDTFPFDFITHIELQKRQIPYILLGATVGALAVTSSGNMVPIVLVTKGILSANNVELANLSIKGVLGIISLGLSYVTSGTKKENQYLEQLLNNYILYNKDLIKFRIGRRNINEKDFKGRIPKFAIKK